MKTLRETQALIEMGGCYWIFADEKLLRQLPAGNWVGASIPYFMCEEGGVITQDMLMVKEAPEHVGMQIRTYDAESLPGIYQVDCSLGFIVIPSMSEALSSFAINAPRFPGYASYPLFGMVSGVHLDRLHKDSPVVVNGQTLEFLDDKAICMHVQLPDYLVADVDVVTLFHQNTSADVIEVTEKGFVYSEVLVNGEPRHLTTYLKEKDIDTRQPLVADYCGAQIASGFLSVHENEVCFAAPLFTGVKYHVARDIGNYAEALQKASKPFENNSIYFYCNCLWNFLFGELEGKKSGALQGPATFGEIAYQLVNQTGVILSISRQP